MSSNRHMTPCHGFYWVGQPWSSCDNCGFPAWEHVGLHQPASALPDATPFDEGYVVTPWEPGEAETIRQKWEGKATHSGGR
jgi:hypothetical protein